MLTDLECYLYLYLIQNQIEVGFLVVFFFFKIFKILYEWVLAYITSGHRF